MRQVRGHLDCQGQSQLALGRPMYFQAFNRACYCAGPAPTFVSLRTIHLGNGCPLLALALEITSCFINTRGAWRTRGCSKGRMDFIVHPQMKFWGTTQISCSFGFTSIVSSFMQGPLTASPLTVWLQAHRSAGDAGNASKGKSEPFLK